VAFSADFKAFSARNFAEGARTVVGKSRRRFANAADLL
jgi:hypothetical protein